MPDHEPTIRSRELGEGLRRAMERAGLNGAQVAHQLGLSPSWISRLLSGKRNVTAVQVAGLLAVCRVTGTERDRLLALCDEQHVPGWFQQHGSRLPQQLVTLIDHETMAVAISEFQEPGMPGLLQTGDYARALLSRSGTVPAEEVEGSGRRPAGPSEPVQPGSAGALHLLCARVRAAAAGGRPDGNARSGGAPAADVEAALPHAAGGAGCARRARWDGWGVHAAGVRRFPAGGLSGE